MAAMTAMFDVRLKNEKKTSGRIFMVYRLVKFEVDPISIEGDMQSWRNSQVPSQTFGLTDKKILSDMLPFCQTK